MNMTINNKHIRIPRIVFLLTVALVVFTGNSSNLYAQHSNSEINKLEKKLNSSTLSEKVNILKELVYECNKANDPKFVDYAQEYVKLNDSLVHPDEKSKVYELLSEYYQNKDISPKTAFNISFLLKYILLLIVIIIILILFVWYLRLKKGYNQKINELSAKAEEVYQKKYTLKGEIEKKLTEKIIPYKKEHDEIVKKEIELKKNLKTLEEANYLKNAFLSNMSHQIRSSLNGISGFANLLETELAIIGDENLYSYAQKIQQSGNKLENLLTNIIDISSIEANVTEKNIQQCDILDIINDVESINTFKANEKGLIFKTKVEESIPAVIADQSKLRKVLNVLIDNSIKYTHKGFVTLMTTYDEDTSTIKIELKDTGVGINSEYAELINTAFSSKNIVENEKSYQGIGIGLKLCKRFIDLMDGKIELITKENEGTSFNITLPTAIEKSEEIVSSVVEEAPVTLLNAPELGSLDIFIVEDDRMNRMVLEKMLKKSGSITTTIDGEDAMNVIKKNHSKKKYFHVMLFDINLPAPWDGTRLMQEVRRLYPEYKNIPFMAQTAYAMAGDKDSFLEAGFDDYIAKPIMKNELLTKIERQIAKYASNKS
ncbi:MAG: hypothetical protein C0598_05185 [Marinilabiliales bacterium]|nr:MAG: hypothetical protein C0598_05185 [Marinilabiliales bacterium]